MTDLPTTFGKYFLTEKLATGGMAEIYLAKLVGPSGFEKQLVIKQIHPTLSGKRQFVDLFVAEAKTLVTLTHGNIVPVYELGVVDETYYIAMDYIDGPTLYRLTEVMARRDVRMEPALAAWIVARILDGLDYAHRKGEGVIHRDVSPRNVMLSRDGDVKLVDFGIAVTLGESGDEAVGDAAPTGSFPYMSPEQVRRQALTVQTDLFTVGVLLWEMLTGKRLFHRSDADGTLVAVTSEPIPRPTSVREDIPERLDDVVMRALERDLDARWPTASAMLAALNKHLYSLDETPGPRDVAALVATHCPPETRRLPTHADAPTEADGDGERHVASGPSTAVLPRAPRGKPKRHESFATNLDYKPILEATGKLTAITDEVATPSTTPLPPRATKPESEPQRPLPERTPPNRSMLVGAGLLGLVFAIGAAWIFVRGRDRVLAGEIDAAVPDAAIMQRITRDDAAPRDDAGVALDDAISEVSIRDASSRDTAPRDAAPLVRRADAGLVVNADAADVAEPRGTATIQVGADPWGDIYVDGRAMGRTPRELVIPAGRHTVEIVFPAETPPRKQTFTVDLASGETKPVQADFSN